MDKNMIKIDDLLRQRLGDAEEQERPGAWLHMRDLLDQQMPVRGVPGGAFNWRRMFGYLGGLVLLLAVSAGGYQVLHSFNSEAPLADNKAAGNTATPTTGLAGMASNTALPQQMQEAPATVEQTEELAVNTTGNNTSATQQVQQNSSAIAKAPVTARKNGMITTTQNSNEQTTNNNSGNAITADDRIKHNNGNNNSNNNQQQIASSGIATADRNDAANSNNTDIIPSSAANATAKKPGNTSADKPLVSKASGQNKTETGITKSGSANSNSNKTADNLAGMQTHPGTRDKKPAAPGLTEKEVPYNKIEIQERQDKNGIVNKDTIFNGEDVMKVKVPKDKELMALNKKDDNNSGSNINPASAAPSAKKEVSEENADMQKLGDHKVASKKMRNYNPHRFEEMVRNAKFRMGAVKFYPGIVGGINATSTGNFGLHGGIAGNLSVSDRWSILAEVKYAHRFNFAKERMEDDYINNVKFANINGQGVYTYDSIEHYYNFGSYASIEMPLLLTYSKNSWVYMLGANFRYNFKISNLQEVEQRYLLEQSLTSTSEPKFDTEKQILLTDFSPTFNIGPMAGVGYQFKPGLRVDLRVNASLWNNASTYGQKEISKSLHNIPQLQLNITHRFRSTKPYKRAQTQVT